MNPDSRIDRIVDDLVSAAAYAADVLDTLPKTDPRYLPIARIRRAAIDGIQAIRSGVLS